MTIRMVAPLLMTMVLVIAGCGPEGPRDQGGAKADPVELLHVLPTPRELIDARPERKVKTDEVVETALGSADPDAAQQLTNAGVEDVAMRNWMGKRGGTMAAIVAVWPTRGVASNFALQVAQHHLDQGLSAWTPSQIPGSQGARERADGGTRVLTRTVGPNAIIITADGPIPDATVTTAMKRLVVVQEARNE